MSHSPAPVRRSLALRRTAVVLSLGALLLSGCSAGGDGDTSTAGATAQDSTVGGVPESAESLAGAADGAAGAPAAPGQPGAGPATLGRIAPPSTFARVGELSVEVADVAQAAGQAARLVLDAGGRVESEQRGTERGNGTDHVTASLRLKVPPESFDAAVAGLSALGEERSRNLGGEDLHDQIVDVDSRLATQRASVARVRALMDRAEDLTEIVQVEAELTRRTADLESLESRLAALTSRVDLSTIELRLVGQDAPEQVAGPPGFLDGLRGGWDALVAIARTIGVTAGALLPFSPFLLLLGYAGWRARTRRTRTPGGPAEATA